MGSSKRINWGNNYPNIPQLNLIKIQTDSWQEFLQKELTETIQSISPISDYTGNNWELELGDLTYDPITISELPEEKVFNLHFRPRPSTLPIKKPGK